MWVISHGFSAEEEAVTITSYKVDGFKSKAYSMRSQDDLYLIPYITYLERDFCTTTIVRCCPR